jgi:hypothetical protein
LTSTDRCVACGQTVTRDRRRASRAVAIARRSRVVARPATARRAVAIARAMRNAFAPARARSLEGVERRSPL